MANNQTVETQYVGRKCKDFQAGQLLWASVWVHAGNQRKYKDPELWEVIKIGRKWITVQGVNAKNDYNDERFDPTEVYHKGIGFVLDGGDWHSPGTIYFDEQHILDLKELAELSKRFEEEFSYRSSIAITLEQMRKIRDILDEE